VPGRLQSFILVARQQHTNGGLRCGRRIAASVIAVRPAVLEPIPRLSLQEPVLAVGRGRSNNAATAQQAFYLRAQLNGAARQGRYRMEMEQAA
jgi:hypothetical protein